MNASAVAPANLNALFNGVEVAYSVGNCMAYKDSYTYVYITFDTPNGRIAVEFMNANIERFLSPEDSCQIGTPLFVSERHGTVAKVLADEVPGHGEHFSVEMKPIKDSCYSISSQHLQAGKRPYGCLLAPRLRAKNWLRSYGQRRSSK